MEEERGATGSRCDTVRAAASAALVAAGGLAASRLGLPAPWLTGPLVLSAALAMAGWRLTVPARLQRLAQGIIGVSVATGLRPETVAQLRAVWPGAVGSAASMLALGAAAGFALARLARVDRRTAVLGFVPGGASGIVAASQEMEVDAPAVTLVQHVRLSLATAATPLLVLLAAGPPASRGAPLVAPGPGSRAPGLSGTLVALAAGLALAGRLRVPAGPVLLPMLLSAGLQVAGWTHRPLPVWSVDLAMAVIGTWVGMQFDRRTVARYLTVGLWAAVLSAGLIAGGLGVGWALHRATGMPLVVCLLATAPGGTDTMTATALALDAAPGVVLVFHVVRMVAALLLGPLAASRLPPTPVPQRDVRRP